MQADRSSAAPDLFILTSKASPPLRLRSALAQAASIVDESRIRVIHGATPADAMVANLFDAKSARRWSKHAPVPAEIACYATHRMGWQALLDGGGPWALILEDDFVVSHDEALRAVVAAAGELLSEGRDLLKLSDMKGEKEKGRAIHRTISGIEIVKSERIASMMIGYLISRDGALKFLARPKVFRVVDEDIKYHWELGLDIWSMPGNLVTDGSADLGGSMIEDTRKAARKRSLWRSLKGNLLAAHRNWLSRRSFDEYVKRQGPRG